MQIWSAEIIELSYHAFQLDRDLSEAHTVPGALLNYGDWNLIPDMINDIRSTLPGINQEGGIILIFEIIVIFIPKKL
jgi:hypothetical protein